MVSIYSELWPWILCYAGGIHPLPPRVQRGRADNHEGVHEVGATRCLIENQLRYTARRCTAVTFN